MATPAVRLKFEKLRDVQRCMISRFTIPDTAALTLSPVYSLDVGTREGKIQILRVASVSGADYTVSFRVRDAAANFTVDEVLRVEGITTTGYQEANLGVIYSNEDEVDNPDPDTHFLGEIPLLYLQIENVHPAINTGVVTIELVIEAGD